MQTNTYLYSRKTLLTQPLGKCVVDGDALYWLYIHVEMTQIKNGIFLAILLLGMFGLDTTQVSLLLAGVMLFAAGIAFYLMRQLYSDSDLYFKLLRAWTDYSILSLGDYKGRGFRQRYRDWKIRPYSIRLLK